MRLFSFLVVLVLMSGAARAEAPRYQERESRSWGDGASFLELFGADVVALAKSPFEMDQRAWTNTAIIAGYWGFLFAYDEDIQRSVEQNRDDGLLNVLHEGGSAFEKLGLMGATNRYYAAGIAIGYAFKWEKLERVSTDILFSHFVGGIFRQGFVRIVGRSRPNEDEGAYNFESGRTSMPSGHSSTIFQLATVLSYHFPVWWAKTAFYSVATLVAVQRVTSDQHWASDSLLGAAYGHAVGRVIVRTNDARGYLVTPAVMPGGGVGMALRMSW